MSSNPLVFDVASVVNGDGLPETFTQTGQLPSRIGPEMIAYPKGADVAVEATVTPLGSGVLVDASLSGQLAGQCVRCLRELTPTHTVTVSQVFSGSDDFISGDAEDDADAGSGDEVPQMVDEKIDLEQAFVDETGLNLPFNPVCEPACPEDSLVPSPDGVAGEDADVVDPRWAGLEKFLQDGSSDGNAGEK